MISWGSKIRNMTEGWHGNHILVFNISSSDWFAAPTWRLSLLFVRAPGVCAGFQHHRQQQQHSLLPLITVSWCQIAVRKLTQPFHKPYMTHKKDFDEQKLDKRLNGKHVISQTKANNISIDAKRPNLIEMSCSHWHIELIIILVQFQFGGLNPPGDMFAVSFSFKDFKGCIVIYVTLIKYFSRKWWVVPVGKYFD